MGTLRSKRRSRPAAGELLPLCPRRPRAAGPARSSPSPDRRPDIEPSGFSQGLPEGPPLGALDGFRTAQTMIAPGMENSALEVNDGVSRRWPLSAQGWSAGRLAVPARVRLAGMTAADPQRAVAWGSARAAARRAPQVLRRNCQSGRDECPAGACAARRARQASPRPGHATSRGITRRMARGALRAPLKPYRESSHGGRQGQARQARQANKVKSLQSLHRSVVPL
jgi:hypothetical protein